MDTKLQRMIELARCSGLDAASVLFRCGEFTIAEVIEYLPQVMRSPEIDPIRQGEVS